MWSERGSVKPVSLSTLRNAPGSPTKSSTVDLLSYRVNSIFIMRTSTR